MVPGRYSAKFVFWRLVVRDRKNEGEEPTGGLSRRSFLGGASAGLVGISISPYLSAAGIGPQPTKDNGNAVVVKLSVNGEEHDILVEPRMSLLFVLRERIGLTGTKVGCERGECGACTVHIDDEARYACLTLAIEAQGRKIVTIEGLSKDGQLSAVQEAFVENDAFQCGYCTSGQIMAAEALLKKNPSPTVEEVREAMSGNLCRCGAYKHIVEAVMKGSKAVRGA